MRRNFGQAAAFSAGFARARGRLIVTADGDLAQAVAGQSITLTLADEIDVSRGDVLAGAAARRLGWHWTLIGALSCKGLAVILPMLLPGVVAGALFTFLVSTNIFLLTFFLGQGQIVTLPTLLFSKIAGGTLDASAAGITLIVTLPGIILLIISERFIKEEAFGKGFGN